VKKVLPYWHPDADYSSCPFFIRKMDTKGYVKAAQVPMARLPMEGFIFLVDGEVLVEAAGKSYLLTAGHLLLIPKDTPFAIHYYKDAVGHSGGFSPSLVPGSRTARLLTEPVQQAFWFDEGLFAGELFKMLQAAFERGDLAFLEKGMELLLLRVDPGRTPGMPALVSDFLDRLFRPDEIPGDIAAYAAQLCVSGNYLSRRVKQATGRSVGAWIDIARIGKAKRLLKETDLPVIDIAAAVGLEDQSYFSRFFRQATGQTPSSFRKMMQG